MFELLEHDHQPYANIRTFWRRGEKLIPSSKGITLAASLLPDLETGVAKLRLAAAAREDRSL